MCRFLLVRSKEPSPPAQLLTSFARACELSRAPDGDRQADGWGIAWKEGDVDAWQLHKSLQPIWQDQAVFSQFPRARLWVAHARSAGFIEHKGILSHNQPYLSDGVCFVFNGMVRGVRLPNKVAGEIGAQKIFALALKALETRDGVQTLRWVDETLVRHSRHIVGMNIGLVKDNRFYLLCEYGEKADYFGLNYCTTGNSALVCSEKLEGYEWQTMSKGEVLAL